jgi:glycerol-1-phosphatase
MYFPALKILAKQGVNRVGGEIGVDPVVILQTSHGRRSIDILKILAPEKANWECESAIQAVIRPQ